MRKKDTDIIKIGKRQQRMRNTHGITSCSEMTDARPQPHLYNRLLVDLHLDLTFTISMTYIYHLPDSSQALGQHCCAVCKQLVCFQLT